VSIRRLSGRRRGAGPAGNGFARLRRATLLLPDDEERDGIAARVADAGQEPETHPDGILVFDPSGNALLLGSL